MPTYEYRCEDCGHTFDVVQGFSDAPLTACEVCGGTLRKVFAPVGIVFKGSGFYKTDSRSGSSRSGGGAKEPAAKDAASTESSSSSDTTPAPAPAASGTKEPSSPTPAKTPAPAAD